MSNSTDFALGELKERLRLLGAVVEAKTNYFKIALLYVYFTELMAHNPHNDDDTGEMTIEKNLVSRIVEALDELLLDLETMGGRDETMGGEDELTDILGSEIIY